MKWKCNPFVLSWLLTSLILIQPCFAQYVLLEGSLHRMSKSQDISDEKIVEGNYYFGRLGETGELVIGIGEVEYVESRQPVRGCVVQLISPDGTSREEIARDVVRAYPAPSGRRVALIPTDLQLTLWLEGEIVIPPIEQRVIQVSWTPDAETIVFTGYPSDYSAQRANNPDSLEEFYRLNNSEIYSYNLKTQELRQLTDEIRADYNPLVSPDGNTILFISTRTNFASFFSMNLDGTNLQQLTNFQPERGFEYRTPVCLSDKMSWHPSGEWLYYETSNPKNESEIWAISRDGVQSEKLGMGHSPALAEDGRTILYISPQRQMQKATFSPALIQEREVQ